MRKIVISTLGILGISLIIIFFVASNKSQEIPELNQDFFDTQVGKFLSSEKITGEIKGAKYTINDLNVLLHDDTVEIRIDMVVVKSGFETVIDVSVQGYPKYGDKKFYFIPDDESPPVFHKLDVSGGFKSQGKWNSILSKIPIVEEQISSTVKNVLADEELVKTMASSALYKGLSNFPVYKLGNSLPETAFAVAIDDFKIENKILKITVSFWNLISYFLILLIIGIGSICAAFAMLRNPALFVGFALIGGM